MLPLSLDAFDSVLIYPVLRVKKTKDPINGRITCCALYIPFLQILFQPANEVIIGTNTIFKMFSPSFVEAENFMKQSWKKYTLTR